MATLFMDPVNGNDANNGTTYALRFKTFNSGATAGRTAPGDTIRIASSTISSLGSATWTDATSTIVLAGALTANVDTCDTAWTAAANVSQSQNTTSNKEGSAAQSFAIAGAFTTGKVAHHALGASTDFSAYKQVSFWFRCTKASLAAGDFQLKLCSDTLGATPVNTINIPATGIASLWQSVTVDTGGTLGATIQSVALYAAVDPGANTAEIDNILACKDSTSADALTLHSLIGKKTSHRWYPIRSINGTTVTIANISTAGSDTPSSSTSHMYHETTESVTTYRLEPTDDATLITGSSPASASINESGTNGNLITYSGGWDTPNMTNQNGYTAFSGINANTSSSFIDLVGKNYLGFQRLIATRVGDMFFDDNAANNDGIVIDQCFASGISHHFYNGVASNFMQLTDTGAHGLASLITASGAVNLEGNGINFTGATGANIMITGTGSSGTIDDVVMGTSSGGTILGFAYGLASFIRNVYFLDYQSNAIAQDTSTYVVCQNVNSTTPILSSGGGSGNSIKPGGIYASNIGLDVTKTSIQFDGALVTTDTTIRHTPQGISWKVKTNSNISRTASRPVKLKLPAQFYKGGVVATLSAWMYRDSVTSLRCQLVMPMSEIPGLSADVTALSSGTINTWQQKSIQFTPTFDTVASPEFWVWESGSGSNNSAYIDDISFS